MLFSKGTPIWIDLSPFFVNIDRLLIYLKKNRFTGHVRFDDKEKSYLVLLCDGDAVAGAEKNHADKIGTGKSANEIMSFASDNKSITLSIFRLPEELVDFFTNVYSGHYQILHKNIQSDFSDIPKFLEKMQTAKFNGYIHFDYLKVDKNGIIVLRDGNVISVITRKIELTDSDPEPAKIKLMRTILSESVINGAVFDIYQINP